MKNGRALIFGLIIFLLVGCRDGSDPSVNSGILGKWNIVQDNRFTGVGLGNHEVDYTGQPGDYFDVRSNGFIYVKEGSGLDTLAYVLKSSKTVTITGFGVVLNGTPPISVISYLTATNVIIAGPLTITPGGEFTRTIMLSK